MPGCLRKGGNPLARGIRAARKTAAAPGTYVKAGRLTQGKS